MARKPAGNTEIPPKRKTRRKTQGTSLAGRPLTLTDDLTFQIRTGIAEGLSNKEIQEKLSIPEGTWHTWYYRDSNGIREVINRARRERLLNQAETVLDEDLHDKGIRKIRNVTAQFVAERLGKDAYSTRIEEAQMGNFTVNVVRWGNKEPKEAIEPTEEEKSKEPEHGA